MIDTEKLEVYLAYLESKKTPEEKEIDKKNQEEYEKKAKIVEKYTVVRDNYPHFITPSDIKFIVDDVDDFYEKSIGSTRLKEGFYPHDVLKYLRLKIIHNK